MRTNNYGGKCASCSNNVAARQGFAFPSSQGWKVACGSTACHRALGLIAETNTARTLDANGKIIMPYDSAALPLLLAMPGARFNQNDKTWSVSLTIKDRERVLELADRLKLDVAAELRTFEHAPETKVAIEFASGLALYPFQIDGVRFLASHSRAVMGDDMGLGKTVQALVALPAGERAIVVSPASVKYNWRKEAAKWRPDFTVTVLEGRSSFRMPAKNEIVVVNYDILPAYLKPIKVDGEAYPRAVLPADAVEAFKETTLIVDEAHLCKNYKAARSQKVRELARACARAWLMTGTPLMNKPGDLFGVFDVAGLAGEVFGGYRGFCRLFNAQRNNWGGVEYGTPRSDVPERLRRAMLRRTKAEVLPQLPGKMYQVIDVATETDETFDVAYERWVDHDARSLPDFSEFSSIRAQLAASKIDAAIELVEQYEAAETPLLVFSAHREPVDTIGAREGWAAITGDTPNEERTEIVEKFQSGALKGVALTIAAGGVGLTLTHASNVLFVDLDWTPANNSQAEDRVCRIGQEASSIQIIHLVSNHPLDQHVRRLIAEKMGVIAQAIEATVDYTLPVTANVVEESDEELRRRLGRRSRAKAQTYVEAIADRETKKANRPTVELTPERAETVRAAYEYMLNCCDGAVADDGIGFNKPDAAMSRWVVMTLDSVVGLRTAERILSRYHRQLHTKYPQLFS